MEKKFSRQSKNLFIKNARATEIEFSKLFEHTIDSDAESNKLDHWDVEIKTKIDVKSLKKINRRDSKPNENIHWVEIKGITGELGWLYGKSDYFAFELYHYWIIVSKIDLQNFISKNIIKEFTPSPCLYKLYTRKGRKDVITLITSYDLCYISSTIIKKSNPDEKKE